MAFPHPFPHALTQFPHIYLAQPNSSSNILSNYVDEKPKDCLKYQVLIQFFKERSKNFGQSVTSKESTKVNIDDEKLLTFNFLHC